MFIVNDDLQKDTDVSVVDSSSMFKVLKWIEDNSYQLVCSMEGGSGVIVKDHVLWCGGDVTLAKCGELHEYSGDGNVFLRQEKKPIKLVELKKYRGVLCADSARVPAIPSGYEYQFIQSPISADRNIIKCSGTGVLPVTIDCTEKDLIVVTIGDVDSVMVLAKNVVCWSATLQLEKLEEDLDGFVRFTGDGTIMFQRGS